MVVSVMIYNLNEADDDGFNHNRKFSDLTVFYSFFLQDLLIPSFDIRSKRRFRLTELNSPFSHMPTIVSSPSMIPRLINTLCTFIPTLTPIPTTPRRTCRLQGQTQ